jgi:hypothetical protein
MGLGRLETNGSKKRGALLHRALVSEPGSCIRRLGGGKRSREMRFTRFLRHPAVTPEAIFATAGERTKGLAAGRDVLAIQDSSDLVLGGTKRRKQGFGPVGKGGAIRGLTLHAVLAVDAHSGEVLGLAGGEVWNRTGGKVSPHAGRHLEDKESLRWITGAETAARIFIKAASITVVADRESDIYEEYARRPANVHLLTRMHHNRCLVDGQKLHDQLDAMQPAGDLETVDIPAKPGQPARQAELALRFCKVEIKAPHRGMPAAALRRLPPSCMLWAIDIREVGAPDNIKPIHWRLLSTRAVEDRNAALAMLRFYRMRWSIEEYFNSLKSGGFNIEEADIGEPGAMMTLTAAAAVAAVTVMQLIKARDNPQGQAINVAFNTLDRKIMAIINADYEGPNPRPRQKNPYPPESLAYATWIIGRLGGWTGYYDKPGPKTLTAGLRKFDAIKHGASIMQKDM